MEGPEVFRPLGNFRLEIVKQRSEFFDLVFLSPRPGFVLWAVWFGNLSGGEVKYSPVQRSVSPEPSG